MALAEGYQLVAFLDADNWYHEGHIASLLFLYKDTHSPVCCPFRAFHSIEGSMLNMKETDEDNLVHVDKGCLMLRKDASKLATKWALMPKNFLPFIIELF